MLLVLVPPSLLDAVEVKTSGVGFRAMVPLMAQEVAGPIRTVPQRAAANLDPKTRRVSRVKVGRFGRGRAGCVHRCAVECELAKDGNYGVATFEATGFAVSQTAILFTNYEIKFLDHE